MNTTTDTTVAKPTTTVVVITPDTARRWLAANKINRPLDRGAVAKYAKDMAAGLWHFTNAGIAFDTNGDLADGQHRLHAIAMQPDGFAINMNVTRGLAPDAKFYIDQGKKRTAGNQLAMSGVRNYNHTASGVRLYLVWMQGLLFRDNSVLRSISAPLVQEWVGNHPGLVELANQSHRDLVKNPATPSVARATFFRFAQLDSEDAVSFFASFSSGAGLADGNPILTLRNQLITDRNARRRVPVREELGRVIWAWNSWRAGKSLKRMGHKIWTADTFPEPR